MLSNQEIKARDLIRGGVDAGYRAASYDLRIGQLIDPQGNTQESYKLPPQGIVEVISEERVVLPDNVSAFVTVKTSLCQEGILALSIGIIDPAFDGKISSFLINSSKECKLLQKDDVFLRTTYHIVEGLSDKVKPFIINDSDLLRMRRRASVEKFERTFLSVDTLAEKSAEQVFSKYRNQAIAYVSLAALSLALLTFMMNFATIWLKWPDGPVAAVTNVPLGAIEVKALTEQNQQLKIRIANLERRARVLDRAEGP